MKVVTGPLARFIIAIAVPVITVLTWFSGTDPVNLPKAVLLACIGTALFGLLVWNFLSIPKPIGFGVLLFWLSFLPPLLLSGAPIEQQLFGVYGRNTGLITYLSLSIVFLATVRFANKDLAKKLVMGLMVAGSVNLIISIFQINQIELLNYKNTYKNALGTFGNPNFVSAFLAMASAVPFSFVLNKSIAIKVRVFSLIYLILTLLVIIKSDALQGLFVFFGILFLAILIQLHYSEKKALKLALISSGALGGLTSILGFIGIGPLSQILNQTTVKLRGEYWQAGINMFEKNLFSGVGLNSYGDWYRQVREPSSLVLPGVNTVTSSSHNVFIDFAATGGIAHIAAYLILIAFVITSIVKQLKIDKIPNPIFSSLALAWIGYVVQSIVSIDQIGLSIWGWALGGILIAYPNFENEVKQLSRNSQIRKSSIKIEQFVVPTMVATLLFFLGGSSYLKTLQSDLNWRKNFSTKSVEALMQTASGRPLIEGRLLSASEVLRNNGFHKEALELAQMAIEYKERSYYGWLEIYKNESASAELIRTAKKNLLLLDPLNNENK